MFRGLMLLAFVVSVQAGLAQEGEFASPMGESWPSDGVGVGVLAPGKKDAAPEPEERSRSGDVRVLLSAPRHARLSSQMQGRIVKLPLRLGDSFRKGDLLVAFACDHQMAELSAAEAGLRKARRKLEAQQSLMKLDAVSDLDVQLAAADVDTARAEREKASARVKDCTLRAPYDGRVVRVQANEYETVSPGKELLSIVETGVLRLEALVPSQWLVWLKQGYEFDVHVDEIDSTVRARVNSIGSRVDPVSQTIAIEAKIIDARPGLLPGMSGSAQFKRPDDD